MSSRLWSLFLSQRAHVIGILGIFLASPSPWLYGLWEGICITCLLLQQAIFAHFLRSALIEIKKRRLDQWKCCEYLMLFDSSENMFRNQTMKSLGFAIFTAVLSYTSIQKFFLRKTGNLKFSCFEKIFEIRQWNVKGGLWLWPFYSAAL